MKDRARKRRLTSLFVTVLLFLLGVSLGVIIDRERIEWSKSVNYNNNVLYESSQVQYLLLSELKDSSSECKVLQTALEKNLAELNENLEILLEYEKQSFRMNTEEYTLIKREYLLSNIKYWMLSKQLKETCPDHDAINVLYFYSTDFCDICPNQGVVLTYFKNIFEERLLVFPIDTDLRKDEPVIDLLLSMYDITSYPTLIIEDRKYEGVIEKEELGKILCKKYKNPSQECDYYL